MFADVIEKSGRTRREWAADLEVSPGFLSDLLNGNRVPSLKLAVRIERLTNGAVPCDSWVPDTKGAAA